MTKYNFLISRIFLVCLFFTSNLKNVSAQFRINPESSENNISLHPFAKMVDVNDKNFSIEQIIADSNLNYTLLPNENTDLGFTNHNYWINFKIENGSNEDKLYFLETSRPLVDVAELYIINQNNQITKRVSGDAIPFNERNFEDRKTIFKLQLKANQTYTYFLHLKSDGEVINASLFLHSIEHLMKTSSFEQIIFGIFYGMMIIAAIIYLFFYFALKEQSFLYYSSYVVFIGLMQFAIDGYFYQFITPNSGWLSLHSVILLATIANFLLGRYAQVFLKINLYSHLIKSIFYVLYGLNITLFLALLFVPQIQVYSYPIANVLGLVLLILIISSLVVVYNKTKKIDYFFATGIFFLVLGFIIFILKNFSVLPLTFWTENSSKLGTGMEVIFLSLSMSNLIKKIKNEREELQFIALQRAEEMSELKSYFLSNLSHELRTPLNAIMSFSNEILSEATDSSTKSKCEVIFNSSKSLLNSVNDILDFSKIDKGELRLENNSFEPSVVVNQILNNAEIAAKNAGLILKQHIAKNIPYLVEGDELRLGQIIQNILSNAIKFTSEGFVSLDVNYELSANNNINLLVTISDSGVGIPPQKMNSIYDSFTQESINNKRKFGGLGLGLFLVKKLVDLHNGTVKIESEINKGTTCFISIPFKVIKAEKEKITDVTTIIDYDLKGKSILVVEDNAINQMVIKTITKKWLNTKVSFANNGLEGVNALLENTFDIVLMDLQMPIMDGYEATIAIRKGEAGAENKNIPIIAITADIMDSTKDRVLEIGMNKYMTKPVDKESLFKNIFELLN